MDLSKLAFEYNWLLIYTILLLINGYVQRNKEDAFNYRLFVVDHGLQIVIIFCAAQIIFLTISLYYQLLY